jgi:hypothetical protein
MRSLSDLGPCYTGYRYVDREERENLIFAYIETASLICEYARNYSFYRRIRKIMLKVIEDGYKPEIITAEETGYKTILTVRSIPRLIRADLLDSWRMTKQNLPARVANCEPVTAFDTAMEAIRVRSIKPSPTTTQEDYQAFRDAHIDRRHQSQQLMPPRRYSGATKGRYFRYPSPESESDGGVK